jgi:hypothetical protein
MAGTIGLMLFTEKSIQVKKIPAVTTMEEMSLSLINRDMSMDERI